MLNYLEQKETDRLIIRPLTMDDIKLWTPFFYNPKSIRYFPNFLTSNPKEDATSWISKQLVRYENGKFGLHALIEKSTGRFIGQCGLLEQDVEGEKEIEIGYSLLHQFEGKGYAAEASRFFKNYAFENNITNSLVSIIHVYNIASQKVAMKNGMKSTKKIPYQGIDVFVFRINK